MADSALEKGLPLAEVKMPDNTKKMTLLTTTSLRDSVNEVEEGTSAEAEGKLERLSCAALTWFNTLSATIGKADHLKSWFYSCKKKSGLQLVIYFQSCPLKGTCSE